MARRTSWKNLNKEVNKILQDFSREELAALDTVARTVADEALAEVQSGSPVRTGHYQRGWKVEAERTAQGCSYTVYNSTDWQLEHLLEYGHKTPTGGRTRAFPHIQPAKQRALQEFKKRLEAQL